MKIVVRISTGLAIALFLLFVLIQISPKKVLTEEHKKAIFSELKDCRYYAWTEATEKYSFLCSPCSAFVADDEDRHSDMMITLYDECKDGVLDVHQVTSETGEEILKEGDQNGWPVESNYGMSACCFET